MKKSVRYFKTFLAYILALAVVAGLLALPGYLLAREDEALLVADQIVDERQSLTAPETLSASTLAVVLYHGAQAHGSGDDYQWGTDYQHGGGDDLIHAVANMRDSGIMPAETAEALCEWIVSQPGLSAYERSANGPRCFWWPNADGNYTPGTRVGCYAIMEPYTGTVTNFTWSGFGDSVSNRAMLDNYIRYLELGQTDDWIDYEVTTVSIIAVGRYSPSLQLFVSANSTARSTTMNQHTVKVVSMDPETFQRVTGL